MRREDVLVVNTPENRIVSVGKGGMFLSAAYTYPYLA